MARIRSIHPDAIENEKLILLTDGAERTYWRLLTQADDVGRGKDGGELLASKLYPADTSKTAAIVDRHLDELVRADLLIRYEIDGKRFYEIHDFTDWQSPRHPSPTKIPDPPDHVPPLPDASVTAFRRTPTDNAPESGAGVGEEKEIGEGGDSAPDRRSAHHDLLPPGASLAFKLELDQIIDGLLVVYGSEQVEIATLNLIDRGVRFQFPSKVRQALEQGMTAPTPARPSPLDAAQAAQRLMMDRRRDCQPCGGSGWLDPDAAGGVVLECPHCSTSNVRSAS